MKQKPENLEEVIEMVEDYMVYYINERPQRKLGGLPPSLYKKQLNMVLKNGILSVPTLSTLLGPPQTVPIDFLLGNNCVIIKP